MRGGIEKCVAAANISTELDAPKTQTAAVDDGSKHSVKVKKTKRVKATQVEDPAQDSFLRRITRYYRGRATIIVSETGTTTIGVRIANKQHAAKRKGRRSGGKRALTSSPVAAKTPPFPIHDKPNEAEPIPGDPLHKQKPDPPNGKVELLEKY
jgi:hypothetical protein